MPHPQDIAVPSLPEPELPPLPATQLRFQVELTPTGERLDYTADQMNTRWLEGYEAGRAAGRASAEPEVGKSLSAAVADSLRPYLSEGERVIWQEPFRWKDDNGVMPNHFESMSLDALAADFGYTVVHDCGCAGIIRAAAPTPTASIAPKAEGETVAPAANGPKYNPVWAELHPCGDSWHGIDADGDGVTMTEGEFNESIRLGATVGDPDRRAAPVAQAAAGAREPIRKLLAEVLLFFHDCSESIRCIDRVVDLEERIGDALARPEADADRASGGGV